LCLISVGLLLCGCSSGNNPDDVQPEVLPDGTHVMSFYGKRFYYPPRLEFQELAWKRESPIWTGDRFHGYEYSHPERSDHIRFMATTGGEDGGWSIQEGHRGDQGWVADGKERMRLEDGAFQEFVNVDGVHHGPWQTWSADGVLQAKATMVDGVAQGKMTYYHPNGQVQGVVQLKDGKPVSTPESR